MSTCHHGMFWSSSCNVSVPRWHQLAAVTRGWRKGCIALQRYTIRKLSLAHAELQIIVTIVDPLFCQEQADAGVEEVKLRWTAGAAAWAVARGWRWCTLSDACFWMLEHHWYRIVGTVLHTVQNIELCSWGPLDLMGAHDWCGCHAELCS
jgi:hypothetical protein